MPHSMSAHNLERPLLLARRSVPEKGMGNGANIVQEGSCHPRTFWGGAAKTRTARWRSPPTTQTCPMASIPVRAAASPIPGPGAARHGSGSQSEEANATLSELVGF